MVSSGIIGAVCQRWKFWWGIRSQVVFGAGFRNDDGWIMQMNALIKSAETRTTAMNTQMSSSTGAETQRPVPKLQYVDSRKVEEATVPLSQGNVQLRSPVRKVENDLNITFDLDSVHFSTPIPSSRVNLGYSSPIGSGSSPPQLLMTKPKLEQRE